MKQQTKTEDASIGSATANYVSSPPQVAGSGLDQSNKVAIWDNTEFQTLNELVSDSGHGKNSWHSFSHYKCVSSKVGISSSVSVHRPYIYWDDHLGHSGTYWYDTDVSPSTSLFGGSFGPADSPLNGLPPMYLLDGNDLVIPAPAGLNQLLTNAALHLLPGMKPNLSLVNSILELKDLHSIVGTCSHLKDSILRLVGKSNAPTHLTLRELARRQGDTYLQYKFNIAPMISDVQGIFKSFKRYQALANRLVSQSAKALTRHHSVTLNEIPSENGKPELGGLSRTTLRLTVDPGFYDVYSTPRRTATYGPSKFHVEMQYDYRYTEFQRQHAALFSVMDSLGVNFNPAIVWNAIPWSFVVDWVVNVSSFLAQFRTNNMEPVINIRRCLWSIKRSRSIACSFDVQGHIGIPASSVEETTYCRVPYMVTTDSIKSSGLSLTEVSLGAALVSTRRPRHKTR